MTPENFSLDDRIQKIERLYAVLKNNVDMINPKKIIEFQAETVSAIKALNSAIKIGREESSRRTTMSVSIVGLVLVAVQVVLALWPHV